MNGMTTGKQRASRIPLDYFKRPDRILRWRGILTGIALVAALAWWLSGFVRSDQGALMYSRGPVAKVHQAWDADCAACHVSFAPMGQQTGISRVIGGAHASDQACSHCHAGPAHAAKQIAAEVHSCADCHRDHRGRDADLLAMADSGCINCHGNLPQHITGGTTTFANVSRYAPNGDHPQFKAVRSGATDPGHLLFNHEVHLKSGLGASFKVGGIADPAEQRRYQAMQPEGQRSADAAVQLACAACHVTDAGDLNRPHARNSDLPPTPTGGAYMLPIRYENHCQACHPLTVEGPAVDGKTTPLAVPHLLQPAEVHDFLSQAMVDRLAADKKVPLLDEDYTPRRPLPGAGEPSAAKQTLRKARDQAVEKAEIVLFRGKQTCTECHEYQGEVAVKPGTAPTFTVVPPQVPDVWFTHGRFDHTAHRAVTCASCHAGATTSRTSKDVLVPGIENCKECHAPAEVLATGPRGGVRSGCTECHRYHHRDEPLQGPGAAARGVAQRMTISQFLLGQPPRP